LSTTLTKLAINVTFSQKNCIQNAHPTALTRAAESTLLLITAAVQRRSRNARDGHWLHGDKQN